MSTTTTPTIEIDDRRGEIHAPAIIVTANADLNGPQPTRHALRESVSDWRVPITAGHPRDASGTHVPVSDAPSPEVVGALREPEWVDSVDGIRGQMVLDADALAAAGELGAHALETLLDTAQSAGRVDPEQQVNVSVGYHFDERNGRAVALEPDHLAIVAEGACSPETTGGGCGAPRVQSARSIEALVRALERR